MDLQEQKINIRGININYLKTGSGEHPILLIPGSLGSIWLHFRQQVEKFDRKRFTIVAWDPPGWGKSRPPNRVFTEDFLQTDATFANDLMQALGHKTFSVIGYCGGGKTAVTLAAMYPDSVRKMIIIGATTYLSSEEMTFHERRKNVDNWSEHVIKEKSAVYEYDYMKNVWCAWTEAVLNLSKKQNGDICSSLLEKVQCQTLIVQGIDDTDFIRNRINFLNTKIRQSRVHLFKNGPYRVHEKFADEFNDLAANFLSASE